MAITKATNSGLVGIKYNNVSADNYYMEPIATTLVGAGGVANIEFTRIPLVYKHLQIRYIVKNSSDAYTTAMQFNSDTGANYFWHILNGNGSTPAANAYTSQSYIGLPRNAAPSPSNTFYVGIADILDYTSVNKNKTIRGLGGGDNNGSGHVDFTSGAWGNSSAISSIKLYATTGNLAQNSRFSLYGIRG
jgi:hypothetical protein